MGIISAADILSIATVAWIMLFCVTGKQESSIGDVVAQLMFSAACVAWHRYPFKLMWLLKEKPVKFCQKRRGHFAASMMLLA